MKILLSKKLRITERENIFPVNEPSSYKKSLGKLPAGALLTDDLSGATQIHWFVKDRSQMEKELGKMMRILKPGILLWIFYPKGTSKIQTDLTRDKGWDSLMKHDLQWISLISFNETWSTFACRLKTENDLKKAAAKPEREIFKYVDPKTKVVKLPNDLAALLKKNKKQSAFFHSISFTGKKEYIEWIITAKRKETRMERLKGTMERLGMGWKNPRNE
ncbi:MAG: YdeI/OmpD-associated family protein [Bacteroidetes bacterium]|nr:YdeI/OmpD-associated family protein [Bacteroidota bacterium]